MRSSILYIAMSLDGFIAKPGDDIQFLMRVAREGEDYGYGSFIKTVDTVIMGRKTYDKVLSMGVAFPHGDKECYILTRTAREGSGNLRFYTDDMKILVNQLKQKPGKNIFIDGGAEITNALLKEGLIDELYISIIPVILGNGVRLFGEGNPETGLMLQGSRHFETGLVQLHYITEKK